MASTKLYRTFGTPTNLDKWTCSVWVKRTKTASEEFIFEGSTDGDSFTDIRFDANDKIQFSNYNSGYLGKLVTTRKFRDVAAWYHIVAVWDSDNATPGDRMKLYINGVEETIFDTDTNPTSGEVCDMGSGSICYVGVHQVSNAYFTGLMAHLHFADGQAYAPTVFGSTDATSGIWVPNTGPSVTYGDNGLFLKFASGAFGTDSSGEGNTMTVAGTMTATKDDAQNNFCTMNPLDNYYAASTFTNGNTTVQTATSPYTINTATMGLISGKWYWECKLVADSGSGKEFQHGITDIVSTSTTVQLGHTAYSYAYITENGDKKNNNSASSYGTIAVVGDIISVALDLDNLKIYYAKNGTWENSGVPTSGATGTGAAFTVIAPALTTGGQYFPANGEGTGAEQLTYGFNFGNGYFGTTVVASTNADDAGIGSFEYDVPTGYYTICTKNISTYG